MKKVLAILLSFAMLATLVVPVMATVIVENSVSVVATKDKAIIVIPGIGYSKLKNSSNQIVWYNSARIANLACTETGTSVNNLVADNSGSGEYGVNDKYSYLCSQLYAAFGTEYDILFFSYDWRLSNADSADALEEYIDDLGYDEVILVAHSMGGLVASSYLTTYRNRTKVDKLITLGTPYLGSPAILYTLENGDFILKDMDDSTKTAFKNVANNFPSIYETLPISRSFVDYIESDNVTVSGYSETYSFLTSCWWAKKSNGTAKPMFAAATSFHNSLMVSGVHVTELSSVETYRIYGMGKDTITTVRYFDGVCDEPYPTNQGDDTVLYLSAINNSTLKTNKWFYASHMELVTDQNVIGYVLQCINGTATLSLDEELEINDRGWVVGLDNKRITVIADGVDGFWDILNSTVIQTSDGVMVVRDENKLYVEENDGTRTEVGTIWQAGGEAVKFFMRDGEYSFTFSTNLDNIVVEYSDSGYYERVLEYDLSNVSSVNLEVSDYDTKEVSCVTSIDETSIVYSSGTISVYELPEDQLFDYKNPNK